MTNPELKNLLVAARQEKAAGNFAEALKLASKANQLDPQESEPYMIMGQCQRALDKPLEAIKTFEFLLSHFPDSGELYIELSLAKWGAEKKGQALQYAKKAYELNASSRFVLEGLGQIAGKLQFWPEMILAYSGLVEIQPDHVPYYEKLLEALKATYRFEEATRVQHHIIRLSGENGENLYNMGLLFFSGNLFKEAIPWFERAAKLELGNEKPVFYLARCQVQLGKLEAAKVLAQKALSLRPTSVHTLELLLELAPENITEADILPLKDLIKSGRFDSGIEHGLSHLFLGKVYQKDKKFDLAFDEFKTGNELLNDAYRKNGIVYNPEAAEAQFSKTKALFGPEEMAKMSGGGSNTEVPILIVSMPRSGTTLLEQIISMHSKVKGVGEFKAMDQIVHDLNMKISKNPTTPVSEVVRKNAGDWAKIYLAELNLKKGEVRATDKMPVNFLFLGIFQAMFPSARVIHIKRHPLDICLSLYTNDLRGSYPYTTTFENLAHYFNLYADLMRFWRDNLSMKFMELSYAELVENPEEKTREILDFCGLEFEDRVLEFYKGRKSAYTISQVQVSEPINKKGIDRWRPYAKHIGPLIEALDEDIVGPL